MRDEDKPFICYKSGWSMKIVPRNAAGWWRLFAWLGTLAPLVGAYIWWMSREHSPERVGLVTVAYGAALVGWSIAMIVWMKARSEIVDMNELLDLKRERDRARSRNRR